MCIYMSFQKSSGKFLSSQIFRGTDWCLTQFSGAPGGAELSLKPAGLCFQYVLLVHFPCSEFSRLIITAACSFFPSACLPLSSWKDQDCAGTLLGWLFTKKHVSVTRSKSHYWDNYKMIMKHFGDVVVKRTRSFGWSHLQKGDWSQLPWSSGLDILARRFCSKRHVIEKKFFFITSFKNTQTPIRICLFNKWVGISMSWTW